MTSDDLTCHLASTLISPYPTNRITVEEWGRAQAAQAPPWPDELYQEALACLGLISLLQREGRGNIEP
jgi:hypothetical protein